MDEHITLRFDWDDVSGSAVIEILGLNSMKLSDGSASWDEVAICIDDGSILLSVEPDTDQIIITREGKPSGNGWEPIPSLAFSKGCVLGWCWVGINSQGYQDSFTMAFGDVVPDALQPRLTFLAEASSLSCFDLTPHRA